MAAMTAAAAVAVAATKAPTKPASQPKLPVGIEDDSRENKYLYVLPVLFYEFLALALARSLLPGMMVDFFGDWCYYTIGVVETIKGILAFVACPFFGKLSDVIGRRTCLLMTVIGTTLPVCSLALTSNLWVFAALSGFSGIFAATFPLTFAYIADYVPPVRRAPAYGLALATFGLSFSIGPLAGGYIAKLHGAETVFVSAVLLVLVDVLYIVFVLPESRELPAGPQLRFRRGRGATGTQEADDEAYRPFQQWNPLTSLQAFSGSPLLSRMAIIIFLYYTAVWALVSTLMIYVTKQFQLGTIMVAQLLSAFGACTMFAEGVLVRVMVPRLGEKLTMQIGLLGFASQCILIGLASSPWMIFVSMAGSLLSNLVYPAMSSLVSKSVGVGAQGEVLGTINGVRALTEGFGPLTFGFLMYQFEDTWLPGAPYLIAAVVAAGALVASHGLPDDADACMYAGPYGADVHGHDPEEMQGLLMTERRNGGGDGDAAESHEEDDGYCGGG